MERAFKGIWIPADIWLDEKMTLLEKVFLVEIDSLDNDNGCYASNEYFSKFFKLSKNRCSEVIKSLEKKGFISISYIYKKNSKAIEKRVIKVLDISNTPIRNLDRPIRNLDRGYSENCEDNNTVINNTVNKPPLDLVVVEKIKEFFDLDEKDIKKVASAHLATKKEIGYLEEKLKLTSSKSNLTDVVAFLIAAIKNDYKLSITQPKCFIPGAGVQVRTRHHNINQTFMKYGADELEQMIHENQKNKFI